MMALNEKALQEQSYAICGEALEGIIKQDVALGMQKAKLFENESGKKVLFVVADLYSKNGSDEQMPFFKNSLKYINGFELMSFCNLYSKTAARCADPKNMVIAAKDLSIIGKDASKFIKYSAQKGIKDLMTAAENREKTTLAKIETAKKENKDVSALEKELKAANDAKEEITKLYAILK